MTSPFQDHRGCHQHVTNSTPSFRAVNEGPGSMKVVKQIEAGYSVHTEMWG